MLKEIMIDFYNSARRKTNRDFYKLESRCLMPVYRYVCSKCEMEFDKLVAQPSDSASTACLNCEATAQISVSNLFFEPMYRVDG